MDEFLIRALCLAVGLVIGTVLGAVYSTNRHVKRISHATEENCKMSQETNRLVKDLHERFGTMEALRALPEEKPQLGWRAPLRRDDKGSVSFNNIGVLLCVIIVCAAFFSTLNANANARRALERVAATTEEQAKAQIVSDRENACTANVVFGIVDAVNPRARYTIKSSDANITLQKAQLLLLRTPAGASPKQGMLALQTYVKALTTYIKIVEAAKATAARNPYPKREEYERCLTAARTKPVPDTSGGDL